MTIVRLLVADLELAEHVLACLESMGLEFVGDLICQTEDELLENQNLDGTALNEIKEALAQRGLTLSMKLESWPPAS